MAVGLTHDSDLRVAVIAGSSSRLRKRKRSLPKEEEDEESEASSIKHGNKWRKKTVYAPLVKIQPPGLLYPRSLYRDFDAQTFQISESSVLREALVSLVGLPGTV